MALTLYDRAGKPVGATCQTAADAVELLRVIKKAECARDETGLVVAHRARRGLIAAVARARRASPDAMPGQLSLIEGELSPLPHLVPSGRKRRRA